VLLLDALRTLEQAIVRVTRFVIRTTPIGVFAIAAVAAGTLELDTLLRLKAYFLLFAVATLLLTFGILPLVVTALTPLRYREVIGVASDALLTAFVANNVFIVLPILVERMRALLEQRQLASAATEATIEVLVPLGFVFPNPGRLLTLLFVPYAAWLAGEPLSSIGLHDAVRRRRVCLLRQGAGGAAVSDGPGCGAARLLSALHPHHDPHRQARLHALGRGAGGLRIVGRGRHRRLPAHGPAAAARSRCGHRGADGGRLLRLACAARRHHRHE
jgi:hypothetical protein